jgi:hypothetical protein
MTSRGVTIDPCLVLLQIIALYHLFFLTYEYIIQISKVRFVSILSEGERHGSSENNKQRTGYYPY